MITFFYQRPFAQAEEDEHIQEVHTTKYQDDGTNFQTQYFYHCTGTVYIGYHLQGIYRIPYVDEIKANQQQIVYCLCQFFITMKNIYKKQFTVAEQSTGYPYGYCDSYQQVGCV